MFKSAAEAVHCGIAMQIEFQRSPVIPLRIGIHSGEISVDEGKIAGEGVSITSRIEEIGWPGSVLVSEPIFAVCKNNAGFSFSQYGLLPLGNVPEPCKVYAVNEAGLTVPGQHELATPEKSRPISYKLPIYPNAFIGRTNHLYSISSLLQEQPVRLITLLGPGGIGKTRLAVKIAERSVELFDHGVCFVPLDTIIDPTQVPFYIGLQLGLQANFNHSWIHEILAFLKDKQLLLILDNLEQILDTAEVIKAILQACPGVKILATSREILGLSFEIEYPLDSMNRPNPTLFPGPEDLLKFDAIDLFVQKAQASLPGFQLNEDNAPAIVRICQELDGLPLPIELAAARIKLFSPEYILYQLKSNTDLLRTRSRDAILRHQTMRNTVKWSYDLLNPGEQQLFQQLCLFRSGFTLSSLEAIWSGAPAMEAAESFINKSLVIKGPESYGVPRFRMLKLIRDYGLEQLSNNPQRNLYLRRFANYFLAFIAEAQSKLDSMEEARWFSWIEAEYENLEVSLEWLIGNQPQLAGEMGADFWRFHLHRGLLQEGFSMIKKLLALPMENKTTVARLLQGGGTLAHNLGHYPEAKDYFKHCLDIWMSFQDKVKIVSSLNNVAWAEWRIGNYEKTIAYSEEALKISIKLEDRQGQAKSLNNLAWVCFSQGLFEKAALLQRQIIQIQMAACNHRGIAFAKVNLARALVFSGRFIEAEQLTSEGIQLFEQLKDEQLVAFARLIETENLCEKDELEAAKDQLGNDCLPSFLKIGDIWGVARCHNLLGKIHLLRKEPDRAKFHLTKAMDLYQRGEDKNGEADTSLWLSKLSGDHGEITAAGDYLARCLRLAENLDANPLLMHGHFELGLSNLQTGRGKEALQLFASAHYYAEKMGAYQLNKFLSKVHPYLHEFRQVGHTGKPFAPVFSSEPSGQQRQDPRAEPVSDQTEIPDRIEKLLLTAENWAAQKPSSSKPGEYTTAAERETAAPFIRRVREVIEKHLHDGDFSIQDLCREVGMSHSQLHRRLIEYNGQSISKFIRSIRLDKARELLLDPQPTVAAVAYDTGFKDPDYFYRVFKQTFGITPNEFRNAPK